MHPVTFEAPYDDRRNRLTVFFRILLVIPHAIVLGLYGIAALIVAIIAWFAILITGQFPAGLYDFNAKFVRYTGHVYGYLFLLADPYPPFGGGGSYPVEVNVEPQVGHNRLTTFFRLILIIPAYILAGVLNYVVELIGFIMWVIIVITGRSPRGLHDLMTTMLRFNIRTVAYLLLVTDRYPGFSGGAPQYAATTI